MGWLRPRSLCLLLPPSTGEVNVVLRSMAGELLCGGQGAELCYRCDVWMRGHMGGKCGAALGNSSSWSLLDGGR